MSSNFKVRIEKLERCMKRPLDNELVAKWTTVLRAFYEAEPVAEAEILEEARAWAAEGKTFGRWHAEVLAELWREEEQRKRAGFLQ